MRITLEHYKSAPNLSETSFKVQDRSEIYNIHERKQDTWEKTKYTRAPEEPLPELHLGVSRHHRYGFTLTINSIPLNDLYHFSTLSPLTSDKVATTLQSYLESVRTDKKFTLECI